MYEVLFSRQTLADENKVKVKKQDDIPEGLNWVALLGKLTGDDITKNEIVYKTNYLECLNTLAYWHYRDAYIAKIKREQEAASKAKNNFRR